MLTKIWKIYSKSIRRIFSGRILIYAEFEVDLLAELRLNGNIWSTSFKSLGLNFFHLHCISYLHCLCHLQYFPKSTPINADVGAPISRLFGKCYGMFCIGQKFADEILDIHLWCQVTISARKIFEIFLSYKSLRWAYVRAASNLRKTKEVNFSSYN